MKKRTFLILGTGLLLLIGGCANTRTESVTTAEAVIFDLPELPLLCDNYLGR